MEQTHSTPPAEFFDALMSLRDSLTRPEILIEEIPAPKGIAPFSVALEGELADSSLLSEATGIGEFDEYDESPVVGKFIVLHDPSRPSAWGSDFRVVILVRAHIDQEIANDPLITEVAMSWLSEALDYCNARAHNLAGTVTRTVTESLGTVEVTSHPALLEIRASWSPTHAIHQSGIGLDLGSHLTAWSNLLCASIGLPPLGQGFPTRRGARGPQSIA